MNNQTPDRRVDSAMLVASEVLLTLVSLSAVLSFARVFADNSWARPLVTATVVAHLTMAVLRRLRRGLLVTGLVGIVVMALQITWTHYRSTTTAGLPTGRTRDALDVDITTAWNLFSDVKAPAEVAVGFLVIATIAIWVVAYLSDWAAFRLWSAVETVLPSFALFVFVAFFGTDQHRYRYAGLYLAATLVFELLHRLQRQAQEVRWLAGTQRQGTRSLLAAGSIVAAIGVLGAVVAGPALPGAEQDALIDLEKGSNGPDTRVVLSPIVDIRGRLVEQTDVEAFTVRSEVRSYWRLASLDRFDGQIWGADNKYTRASGGLDDDFPVEVDVQTVTQDFEVTALGAVWIPAAFEPRRIVETSDESISYEPTSGTLIVGRELESSNGLTYTVESALPRFDAAALAAAPDDYPQEVRDRYLGLPSDFSPRAIALAQQIVQDAGATNDYQEALALQEYFRAFTYNVNVGAGHSSNRIDEFLDSREGYCEQFAGSFAAMARSLGIPARVAVGFTWGDPDPNDPTLYRVRGEHAHAWPEVYIPGSGWVPFEPTPTRGAPGATGWTNVTPQQAGAVDEPATAPTPQQLPELQTPRVPSTGELPDISPNTDGGAGGNVGGLPGWLVTTGLVLGIVLAVVAAYAVIVPTTKRTRAHHRFASAADNRGRVQALWADANDALRPLGHERGSHETVIEFARRVGSASPTTRAVLTELGSLTIAATYAPTPPADPAVQRAAVLRDDINDAVTQLVTPAQRWRDRLDPRPLFASRR